MFLELTLKECRIAVLINMTYVYAIKDLPEGGTVITAVDDKNKEVIVLESMHEIKEAIVAGFAYST